MALCHPFLFAHIKNILYICLNKSNVMNLNKKVLTLSNVFPILSVEQILYHLNMIKEAKADLEDLLVILELASPDLMQTEISAVNEQIKLANQNIRVLETAMMCYETKAIEKRTIMGEMATFYLN